MEVYRKFIIGKDSYVDAHELAARAGGRIHEEHDSYVVNLPVTDLAKQAARDMLLGLILDNVYEVHYDLLIWARMIPEFSADGLSFKIADWNESVFGDAPDLSTKGTKDTKDFEEMSIKEILEEGDFPKELDVSDLELGI